MRKITFKSKKAFTLVELMIAIGIIILLFALSITSLIRSRMTANETAAIRTLKTLHSVYASFRVINPRYPWGLWELGTQASDPPYIDDDLANQSARRQGYVFSYEGTNRVEGENLVSTGDDRGLNTFLISAQPEFPGVTGNRIFYVDQSGEVCEAEVGVFSGKF